MPAGTQLPDGLEVVADGKDVGRDQPVGHHTIFPTQQLKYSELIKLWEKLQPAFQYQGSKKMTDDRPAQASDKWQRVVDSYTRYLNSSTDLHTSLRTFLEDPASADQLRSALRRAGVIRSAAIYALQRLAVDQLPQYFPELLYLASIEHGQIQAARDLIRALPREWVLARIEQEVEPFLDCYPEETYRRILELYAQLDSDLTQRLARRALAHPQPDVREAGEDFLSG